MRAGKVVLRSSGARLAALSDSRQDREEAELGQNDAVGRRARYCPASAADYNVRVTDLAVTCAPSQTEEAVLTDPVLLIEILSPINRAKPGSTCAYTSIPSVGEILILRADRVAAELQ
jgi:Uma2 family endonuclease